MRWGIPTDALEEQRGRMPSKSSKTKTTNGKSAGHSIAEHGASNLPAVTVDSYNVELKDSEGFIGDRATNKAFNDILDDWRKQLDRIDEDPMGATPSRKIGKKQLDRMLNSDEPEV